MAGEDSTYAVQVAVGARLAADATLSALTEGRVYETPPDTTGSPFVHVGTIQDVGPFEAQGFAGVELFLTIDAWARLGEGGQDPVTAQRQMLQIAAAIRDSLHGQTFPIGPEHKLQLCEHHDTRMIRDQSGRITHGVVEFRCLTTAI